MSYRPTEYGGKVPRWPSLRPLNIGGDEDPYLQRWFILPRNRWFNVYLHRMLRDDSDRGLHDHPGANVSIVLRRGFLEWMFYEKPEDGKSLPPIYARRREPGAVVFRRAEDAHRLELTRDARGRPVPSWSIFVMVNKHRTWGFWLQPTCARWTPWHEALASGDATRHRA